MTRQRRPRLEAAVAAYLEHFGEAAPVAPYLDYRRLPDVLFEAVERGERLTPTTLTERLGPPDPGQYSAEQPSAEG